MSLLTSLKQKHLRIFPKSPLSWQQLLSRITSEQAWEVAFSLKQLQFPWYLYKFIIPLLMLAKIQAHCTILQNVLQSGFATTIKCICHPNYAKQVVDCKTTSKTELGSFIHLYKKCQHEIHVYFVVEVLHYHYYRKLSLYQNAVIIIQKNIIFFFTLVNTSVAVNNVLQNETWLIKAIF